MFAMIVAAFVIGIVVAIPPGPVTISGSQRAITGGFWHAFNFYMGSILSDTFYALLVYFGLSALVEGSEMFRVLLWVLGGAWLCWMGVGALRTTIDMSQDIDQNDQSTRWRTFRAGLLVTLFNPLTMISWVALAGNFFNTTWQADWPPLATFGLIAVIAMLAGALAWVLGLALVLSSVRRMVNPRLLRWVSIFSGLFLIGYGLSAWWSALDTLI